MINPLLKRFYSKFSKNQDSGCWEWTACKTKNGYGKFALNKSWVLAHRWIYEFLLQDKIHSDKLILHKCDNRKCVNPDHLYLGSHLNNAQDRVERKRSKHYVGENHGRSKLTENQVLEIRRLSNEKSLSSWRLGKMFMVNPKSIQDIVNRNNWKHI